MASRKEMLERQLEEARKAENALLAVVSDCMTWPDAKKARVYDEVVPLIRTAVENKIRGGDWDWNSLKVLVVEKLFKVVFGEDGLANVERL